MKMVHADGYKVVTFFDSNHRPSMPTFGSVFSVSDDVYRKWATQDCWTNGRLITAEPPPYSISDLTDDGWHTDELALQELLTDVKNKAISSIDNAVIAIYNKFNPLVQEYALRESEALAFAQANYEGDTPQQIQAFAEPMCLSAQQATDIIIAQSQNMHQALEKLGVLRMQKLAVNNMTTIDDVEAHQTNVLAQISQIAEAL